MIAYSTSQFANSDVSKHHECTHPSCTFSCMAFSMNQHFSTNRSHLDKIIAHECPNCWWDLRGTRVFKIQPEPVTATTLPFILQNILMALVFQPHERSLTKKKWMLAVAVAAVTLQPSLWSRIGMICTYVLCGTRSNKVFFHSLTACLMKCANLSGTTGPLFRCRGKPFFATF